MCDGIITYMEEFLETVEKDPTKITNDQLKRIMNLFHALWKQGLQSLVSSLVKKPNFWSSLCSPILATPMTNYQYSQLLNIMGIELFKLREKTDENENFRKTVEKFLTKEIFSKWLNIVFELPTLKLNDSSFIEDTPEWLGRLQSFKDFLVLLMKRKVFIAVPHDSCKLLLDKSLQALVSAAEEMENGNDLRPFVVLSELFLIVLNDQDLKYTDDSKADVELLKNVETLLKVTTNCYDDSHKRSKDSILAITIKVLDLVSEEIKNHPELSSSFVRYNLEIVCNEFFVLENEMRSENNEIKCQTSSVILSINLLKKILLIGDDFYGNCNYWFNHYKIYNRILNVASLICQDAGKCQITAEIFDLLMLLAKSRYSQNIIYCDIGDYLWMNLTTPRNLTESGWVAKEWWNIYTKGIELVKILLEKEKYNFIKDALFFMGIHEQYLTEALELAKYSLEPSAMLLIKSALEFLGEIVTYEKLWSSDYQLTVHNLMVNY
jgi:nuclear pore complex protein Nup188